MFLSVPPMASTSIIFIVLSITFAGGRAQPKQSSLINLGTSLTYPTSWLSPSSQFAFGFYQQGRGFAVGIWFVGKDNTTIVRTANRDDAPVTSKSMLDFTRDGKILLRTQQGQKQLIVILVQQTLFHTLPCLILEILCSMTRIPRSSGRFFIILPIPF